MDNFPAARFDRTTQPTMLTLVLLASISALAMNIYLPAFPDGDGVFDNTGCDGFVCWCLPWGQCTYPIVCWPHFGPYWSAQNCPSFIDYLCDCIHQLRLCAELRNVFDVSRNPICCGDLYDRLACDCSHTTDTASSGSRIAYVTMGMAVVPMFSPALGHSLTQTLAGRAHFLCWQDLE